jgi:hypothetical protein
LIDLQRRFIHVDQRGLQQVPTQRLDQWQEPLAGLDHPAGQGVARDIGAVTGKDLALPVER